MRTFSLLSAALCLLFAAVVGFFDRDPANNAEADRVAGLVLQLGDEAFARREEATRELESVGEKALPALRRACESEDLEVVRRARQVIRSILLSLRKSKSTGL